MVQAISAGSGRNSAVDGKFPAAVLTRSFDCGAEMLLLVSRQARKGVGDRGCNTEIHVRDPRRQHVGRKLVPLVGAPCPLRGEVEVGGSVRSHTLSVHSRARLQGRTVAAVPPPLWKLYPQRIGKLRPALRCLKTMHVPWRAPNARSPGNTTITRSPASTWTSSQASLSLRRPTSLSRDAGGQVSLSYRFRKHQGLARHLPSDG